MRRGEHRAIALVAQSTTFEIPPSGISTTTTLTTARQLSPPIPGPMTLEDAPVNPTPSRTSDAGVDRDQNRGLPLDGTDLTVGRAQPSEEQPEGSLESLNDESTLPFRVTTEAKIPSAEMSGKPASRASSNLATRSRGLVPMTNFDFGHPPQKAASPRQNTLKMAKKGKASHKAKETGPQQDSAAPRNSGNHHNSGNSGNSPAQEAGAAPVVPSQSRPFSQATSAYLRSMFGGPQSKRIEKLLIKYSTV